MKRERLPVSVSAAVFIEDKKGRLLLLQQAAKWKGQKWGPPAGGMHPFENPIETALRETEEEIGVKVKLTGLVGIYTVKWGPKKTSVGFVFRGELKKGKIKLKTGEIKNAQYFTPNQAHQLIADDLIYKPEYNIQGIKDWLSGINFPFKIIRQK